MRVACVLEGVARLGMPKIASTALVNDNCVLIFVSAVDARRRVQAWTQ